MNFINAVLKAVDGFWTLIGFLVFPLSCAVLVNFVPIFTVIGVYMFANILYMERAYWMANTLMIATAGAVVFWIYWICIHGDRLLCQPTLWLSMPWVLRTVTGHDCGEFWHSIGY